MDILRVEDLSLAYGSQRVLIDISFSIKKGKIVGLLGPNGAGKSSIIKILAGLVFPETGTLYFDEKKQHHFAELRTHCSYLIDAPAFYPYLSGRQNLKLINRINNVDADIDETLLKVGLADSGKKKVKHFSTGMKQRLAIAQAMLRNSPLLILDEPFNGLDPNGFQDLISLLKDLNNEGTTIIVSSHLLNELEQFADDFILLHNGAIALHITKDELIKSKKKVAFTFEQSVNSETLTYLENMSAVFETDHKVILNLNPDQIAATVQELVRLECIPVNVEMKNILQEKYLDLTV
ncbi:ABC transporter ATP-binding protein [Lutimonas sp.]|uniref:ABC transporter ATP-binding protein n=1 Tax=Lutimonas sp. TaxID=1872403 RepID=UPI003C70F075